MVKRLFSIVLFLLVSVSFFNADTGDGYATLNKNGFTLSWKVNGEFLDLKISTECKGWIAIGIDPTEMMKDSDFIIGYVKDGKVYISDEFGVTKTSHKPDKSIGGSDNIKNAAGTEKDNITELSFSIPLDSGDKYDKKITRGTHKVILACSSDNDDFISRHSKKTKAEIVIP